MSDTRTIAVIGGAGQLGGALAKRLGDAGYALIIGSRSPERASVAADAMGDGARAATNAEAAAAGDIVIVAVPFAAQEGTLTEIAPYVAGKIVVETTVPLVPPKVTRVQLPPEGSAAVRALRFLPPDVRLVSAFHNVAAHKLAGAGTVDCDVLVFGDDKDARGEVIALVSSLGMRGLHGGPLVNSAAAEALTSLLIFINKTYSVDGAGLRITGGLSGA